MDLPRKSIEMLCHLQRPDEKLGIKARHAVPANAENEVPEPMEEDQTSDLPPSKAMGKQAAHPAELIDASEVFKTSDDVLEHYARHGKTSEYKFVNCNR